MKYLFVCSVLGMVVGAAVTVLTTPSIAQAHPIVASGSFSVADKTIYRALDSNTGQVSAVNWLKSNLTQTQIDSFQEAILPPLTDSAMRAMWDDHINKMVRSGVAADDPVLLDIISKRDAILIPEDE